MKRVMDGNYLLITVSMLIFAYTGCTDNITGRFQVVFLPENQLQSLAAQEYRQFLGEHTILPQFRDPQANLVRKVGQKLTEAVSVYYKLKQINPDRLDRYHWEYSVIESPEVNAWCLPGGKIVIYSGLLNVTQNESALAVVMSHEIAHALARHGNERMSHSMLAGGIGIVGKIITAGNAQARSVFEAVYPQVSRRSVLLPEIREQELEADKLGLIFTALAGYDAREAIPLWRRMHKATSGFAPPEFLSTHPSEERRIRALKCFMPQALRYQTGEQRK